MNCNSYILSKSRYIVIFCYTEKVEGTLRVRLMPKLFILCFKGKHNYMYILSIVNLIYILLPTFRLEKVY